MILFYCGINLLGHMSEQGLKVLSNHKLLPSLKSLKLDLWKHMYLWETK
jgi:hypothetical protein